MSEQMDKFQCERNKQVLQTAMNNVDVDIINAPYEELAQKFQKEFSQIDIYESLLGHKYEMVKARGDHFGVEFQFNTKYKDGFLAEEVYEFHRLGKCGKDNENCYWTTRACVIYIDENGKIRW